MTKSLRLGFGKSCFTKCRKITVLFAAAFFLGAGIAPAKTVLPRSSAVSPTRLMEEGQMQRVIRTAYQTLARYSAASEQPLSFEIDGFSTLYPERFPEARWLDLVDMPQGKVIDVERQLLSHRSAAGSNAFAVYKASWKTYEKDWASTAWGSALPLMNTDEVLNQAAASIPAIPGVRALTSYSVTVSLAGRSKSYRAAFLWIPTSDPKISDFIVVDQNVQNIDGAVRERVAAAPVRPLRTTARDPLSVDQKRFGSLTPPGGGFSLISCIPGSQSFTQTGSKSSTSGHWGGDHSSAATLAVDCSCDRTCTQTCTARVASSSCSETGLTTECHSIAQDSQTTSETSSTGHTSPAACAAGFGCAVKECLFCLCGVSVRVSIMDTTVNFNSTAGSWDGNFGFGKTCPPCELDPSGGLSGPGSGGSGGGGGSEVVPILPGDNPNPACREGQLVTALECISVCDGFVDGDYCMI